MNLLTIRKRGKQMLDAAGRHQEIIETNGISLRTIVEGDGPLVILLHGFPRCWYLWRHQIEPLKQAGFRVAVPDQRGYGASTCPERIEDYNILELTADIIGLADALTNGGEEKFYLVGHDWGCIVAWYTALLYPHRMHCVMGLSVPCLPIGPGAVDPPGLDDLFWYIRYAIRPRDANMFGDGPPPGKLSPAVTEEDHAYYVASYTESGFRGPVSWYRNMARIPTLAPWLKEAQIQVPAYFVAGNQDPVLQFTASSYDLQDASFADLRGKQLIDGAGHWVQEEKPAEVSQAIVNFLNDIRAEVSN
jgi:pimeloyl-ACP methyl ester carboxylesterase